MRNWLLVGTVGLALGQALPAVAQTFDAGSLPAFARSDLDPTVPRWDGSYARLSSGFQVTSSKRFGTFAGPTIGFEGGKLLREGNVIYGVVGGFDYMSPWAGYGTPRFGTAAYTRDFTGAIQFKTGTFVADNVLVYAKVGVAAMSETFRFGGSSAAAPFNRNDIALRPDARAGVEWAVTDRLSVSVEVGRTGPAFW